MCKHPATALTDPAVARARIQRRSEVPLEAGHHALGVPSPTINAFRESSMHHPSIASFGMDGAGTTRVDRDHRRADPQVLATKAMMRLSVIGGVSQQAMDWQAANRLTHGGCEVGGIIARSATHTQRGNQMTTMIADQRKLRPVAMPLHAALSSQEVSADVAAFQPRGVDAGLGPAVDQAARPGDTENSVLQNVESPFLRSRSCAYFRVE